MRGSLLYAETNGTVDFAAQPGTIIASPGLLPIGNFDNTKRTTLNLKATYRVTKQLSWTAGYSFERYRFSDIGYDGFGYVVVPPQSVANPAAVPPSTGNPPSCAPVARSGCAAYMTGQFAFQPYTANIFYLIGTYKF